MLGTINIGKKSLEQINKLTTTISRFLFEGIGKPETMKNLLSFYWSR